MPTPPPSSTTAAILCVGRELLRGRTRDRNAVFLADRLTALGIEVLRLSVADDTIESIAREFAWALSLDVRVLVITGGLGPTFDDVTLEGVAHALGVGTCVHPRALESVRAAYRDLHDRGLVPTPDLTSEREKMARLPEGARPVRNRVGAAPAVAIESGKTSIWCLPGVPEEMEVVWAEEVERAVGAIGGTPPGGTGELTRELGVATRDESALAPLLRRVMEAFPAVYAKSRVSGTGGEIRIAVTLSAPGIPGADALLGAAEERLRSLLVLSGLGGG